MFDLMIIDDKPYIDTHEIAQGLRRRHEQVSRFVKKYESDFRDIGDVISKRKIYGAGRPVECFVLNYGQAMFLAI